MVNKRTILLLWRHTCEVFVKKSQESVAILQIRVIKVLSKDNYLTGEYS